VATATDYATGGAFVAGFVAGAFVVVRIMRAVLGELRPGRRRRDTPPDDL
jgi:hypothetical protein